MATIYDEWGNPIGYIPQTDIWGIILPIMLMFIVMIVLIIVLRYALKALK